MWTSARSVGVVGLVGLGVVGAQRTMNAGVGMAMFHRTFQSVGPASPCQFSLAAIPVVSGTGTGGTRFVPRTCSDLPGIESPRPNTTRWSLPKVGSVLSVSGQRLSGTREPGAYGPSLLTTTTSQGASVLFSAMTATEAGLGMIRSAYGLLPTTSSATTNVGAQ